MRISEKEHKKLKKQFENKTKSNTNTYTKTQKKQEELPDWFNKELKNEFKTIEDIIDRQGEIPSEFRGNIYAYLMFGIED